MVGVARYAPLFDGRAALSIDRTSEALGARIRAGRRVVLVSIDGLAPRFLEAAPTPALDRLAEEGMRVDGVVTVVPSITMTSHASMLSGLLPEEHGVYFNRYQPWRELRFPTVFSACREARLRCGVFAGKRKFAHFAEQEPGAERYQFGEGAAQVLRQALQYVEKRDPDFLFVHLAEVDRTGHEAGWGSPAQLQAIAEIDTRLGAFAEALAGLPRPLTILVTADHGGTETSHHQDTPLNREIPWILWGDAAGIDPSTIGTTLDTYATVHELLNRPGG